MNTFVNVVRCGSFTRAADAMLPTFCSQDGLADGALIRVLPGFLGLSATSTWHSFAIVPCRGARRCSSISWWSASAPRPGRWHPDWHARPRLFAGNPRGCAIGWRCSCAIAPLDSGYGDTGHFRHDRKTKERKANIRVRQGGTSMPATLRTAATLAFAAIAMLAGSASATRAQTFEFAVWYSDRDFYAEHVRRWASEIEKKTQGRVKIKLHFSGALVPAKETVNAARTGAVGGGTTSISFIAGLVRPVSYMEPLLWIPAEPKIAADTMNKLLAPSRTLLEKRGLKLMFTFPSAGLVTNCINGHIKKTADWKGKKVRAAGRWQGIQLRAVGAAPVAIDPGEVYIALQNKTVDCMMFLANLTLSSKVHEVAPYITYWRDGANASMYFLNLDQWNKVPAADQKVMIEVSDGMVAEAAPRLLQMQVDAINALEKAGAKIYRATDQEISEMKQAMAGVWKEVDKIAGPEGKPFADVIMPLQK
jgi:TRAP-type C4-dicarboxylate transport system substrate-binding protein